MDYAQETRAMAKERAQEIAAQFVEEVDRLLSSSAVGEGHHRGILFGVALENIADRFLAGERKGKDYRNLKRF